ncbi:MAG: hypothetical protein H0U62_06220 [Actinobacteria bacterium]|nr:hypothetical protein [Actinomycetota bacterium]
MTDSDYAGRPGERPLSLDQLAARADLPASADVPQEVGAALARSRACTSPA